MGLAGSVLLVQGLALGGLDAGGDWLFVGGASCLCVVFLGAAYAFDLLHYFPLFNALFLYPPLQVNQLLPLPLNISLLPLILLINPFLFLFFLFNHTLKILNLLIFVFEHFDTFSPNFPLIDNDSLMNELFFYF